MLSLMQDVEAQLAMFGTKESKFPDSWVEFFKSVEQWEKQGHHTAAATACKRVLKTLVYSADAMRDKSVGQEYAYADVTMFIRNWGVYTPEVVAETKNLKVKGEEVAARLAAAKEKMRCLKCRNDGHLDSMCWVKGKQKDFRSASRGRLAEKRDDIRDTGFGRKSSRDRHDRQRYERKW